MRRAFVLALLVSAPVLAQTAIKHVVSARVGNDNRVYVQWSGQPESAVPRDRDYCDSVSGCEVAVQSEVKVSPDRTMVGWLASYLGFSDANYPEPLELVLMRNGRVAHHFFDERHVWDWNFADGGRSVVLYFDVAHGVGQPSLSRFNIRTGKKTGQWWSGKPLPAWGQPFAEDVKPSE